MSSWQYHEYAATPLELSMHNVVFVGNLFNQLTEIQAEADKSSIFFPPLLLAGFTSETTSTREKKNGIQRQHTFCHLLLEHWANNVRKLFHSFSLQLFNTLRSFKHTDFIQTRNSIISFLLPFLKKSTAEKKIRAMFIGILLCSRWAQRKKGYGQFYELNQYKCWHTLGVFSLSDLEQKKSEYKNTERNNR